MAFHPPDSIYVAKLAVIYYPHDTLARVMPVEPKSVEDALQEIVAKYRRLFNRLGHTISFLSSEHGDLLIDAWLFDQTGGFHAPSMATFRNGHREHPGRVHAIESLIVLNYEDLHRHQAHSLAEYLRGPRPALPPYLVKQA